MSEKDFNEIFSRRLRYYLNKYELSQVEFAKRMHVGTTSVSNWVNGVKTPRMDKVDAMCKLFGIQRSDLMTEPDDKKPDDNQLPSYYLDDDARETAEFLHKHPEYRVLFDASRKVRKEDIDFVKEMIDRMSGES